MTTDCPICNHAIKIINNGYKTKKLSKKSTNDEVLDYMIKIMNKSVGNKRYKRI